MEIVVKDCGSCQKNVKVIIPAEEVKEQYEKKIQELKGKAKIRGFRQGHVPLNVLEMKYGKEIENELKLSFLVKGYEKATKEHNLHPLANPKVEENKILILKNEPCEFEFAIEVEPEFELPKYKDMEVKKESLEVTEEEINVALKELKNHYAELMPTETIENEEDIVIFDAELESEGKKIWDKKNATVQLKDMDKIDLIGLDKELLIGKKSGDKVTKEITLPSNYNVPEYSDKKAIFLLEVLEVKKISLPEINDNFAKERNFENLEKLMEQLKKEISMGKTHAEERRIEEELIDRILKDIEIDLPKDFIKDRIDAIEEDNRKQLKLRNKTDEEIEKIIEESKKETEKNIISQFYEYLVIQRISKLEDIKVEESDLNFYFESLARQYKKWPNQVREYYEKNNLMDEAKFQIKRQKVLYFLRENAKYV